MKHDAKSTNLLMRKIFPNVDEVPINSMTPTVSYNGEKTIVSMLILGDKFMIKDFEDENSSVEISASCYAKRNKEKIGKDLTMRFDFYFKTGHPIFEATIGGNIPEIQKVFVGTLYEVDAIYLWVVNEDREIVRILELEWDYNAHKKTLDKFERVSPDIKKCPICNRGYNGKGALSRKDNKTEICSGCGISEVLSIL